MDVNSLDAFVAGKVIYDCFGVTCGAVTCGAVGGVLLVRCCW